MDKTVKHSGTVAAMWSHTWNKYKLNVNFNGRIQGERYSTSYGYAPKYSLWNLNTSHTFRAGDFLLEPGVGIENLFDYVDDRPFNYNYATIDPGPYLLRPAFWSVSSSKLSHVNYQLI